MTFLGGHNFKELRTTALRDGSFAVIICCLPRITGCNLVTPVGKFWLCPLSSLLFFNVTLSVDWVWHPWSKYKNICICNIFLWNHCMFFTDHWVHLSNTAPCRCVLFVYYQPSALQSTQTFYVLHMFVFPTSSALTGKSVAIRLWTIQRGMCLITYCYIWLTGQCEALGTDRGKVTVTERASNSQRKSKIVFSKILKQYHHLATFGCDQQTSHGTVSVRK